MGPGPGRARKSTTAPICGLWPIGTLTRGRGAAIRGVGCARREALFRQQRIADYSFDHHPKSTSPESCTAVQSYVWTFAGGCGCVYVRLEMNRLPAHLRREPGVPYRFALPRRTRR